MELTHLHWSTCKKLFYTATAINHNRRYLKSFLSDVGNTCAVFSNAFTAYLPKVDGFTWNGILKNEYPWMSSKEYRINDEYYCLRCRWLVNNIDRTEFLSDPSFTTVVGFCKFGNSSSTASVFMPKFVPKFLRAWFRSEASMTTQTKVSLLARIKTFFLCIFRTTVRTFFFISLRLVLVLGILSYELT